MSDDITVDNVETEDNVQITLRGPDGEIKQVVTAHNLVTTVGKEKLAEQLIASPGTEKPKYIAVGSGSGTAEASNTALGTEIKRKEASTRTASGKVLTMAVTYSAGEATGEVKEAGIFAASSAGSMYARLTFSVINVASGDSLEIKWTLEYT